MAPLDDHAPIAHRRSRKAASPLVSVVALMAIPALLALVQAVLPTDVGIASGGATVQVAYQATPGVQVR